MEQDWVMGLVGGLMIGLAAAVYLLGNGRIMGASGIVGGLLDGSWRTNRGERALFLAGLIGVPAVLHVVVAEKSTYLTPDFAVIAVAGLLVGIGTRMANGCTSGHGVCGMSRFSARGIVATLIYVGVAMLAFAVLRHLAGLI